MTESNVVQSHYRNGQLQQEEPYEGDLLHGTRRTWHKNGVLETEKPYVHGQLHGTCRQWAEDGTLLGTYEVVRGTGVQRRWHDNGQLNLEFFTLEGAYFGRCRMWLRDGTLIEEKYSLNNEPASRQEYCSAAATDPRLPKYDDDPPDVVAEPGSELDRKQHELFVAGLFEKSNHAEVRQWLAAPTGSRAKRFLGRFEDSTHAAEFVERIYALGAVAVIVADLYANKEGDEFCDHLVIQLPSLSALRRAIRQTCERWCAENHAALQPDADVGESHLCLYFG